MSSSQQPGDWPDPPWPGPSSPYAQPAEPGRSAQPAEPGRSAQPAEPGHPAQPAESGYAAQPGYGQPAYPDYSAQAAYPGYQTSGGPASPAYGYGVPAAPMSRPTNGMAIASMVVSLASILVCGFPAVVGAILGHVARRQIRERGEGGEGMALTGIIVGWAVFALSVIGTILYVALVVWAVGNAPTTSTPNNVN
jgi:hypothetical protein